MKPLVALYVTGHGYGHATRAAALARALRPWRVRVRTSAPAWIFREENPAAGRSAAEVDVGMLQPNGVELDLPRTLAAHLRFLDGWNEAVAREVSFLRALKADLVVGDIPPLAFAAAAKAGLRSAAVSNFSWDWILEEYAPRDAG